MRKIEISDELYKYLMDERFGDCAEAWYTAQIKMNPNDLDDQIKRIIEERDVWQSATYRQYTFSKTYPWSDDKE